MKKMNTKNIFYYFLLGLCIVLYSCSEDNVINNNNGNNGTVYYTTTGFSGKVHDLPDTSRSVLALMTKGSSVFTMGSNVIGTDSMMAISLSVPTSNQLNPIEDFFTPYAGGTISISISDTAANGNYVFLNAFDSGSSTPGGDIIKANTPSFSIPQLGNVFLTYYYSDRPLTAGAVHLGFQGSDTVKTLIAIKLTTGYNIIYNKITVVRTNYREVQTISGDPAGTEWYFLAN